MTAGMPDKDHSEIASELDAEGIPDLHDSDPAVEGMVPPRDHPQAATDHGVTAAEERRGEALADRVWREEPDATPLAVDTEGPLTGP